MPMPMPMPMPFMLVGSIGEYREDIGTPRQGFDLETELELLEFPKAAASKSRKCA